ncbi:MAG: phosphoglucosamine mutase [Gammaproteobacteria bacterium SG8_31]|jgi:phosphoglucosamine mutase|nr:MAG: phosphoglucosamine mutase [Gammaproteobacteria bacterium SG8_31]
MGKYFGTDGVRGQVGQSPMTVEFTLRLASAAARVLAPEGGTVLIGKDTRVSGYMFESALEAGFTAAGVDVLLAGPLPTPGIAYLCRRLDADFGIVISASHNPYYDNGIKFFDHHGDKLSDELEAAIEALLEEPPVTRSSEELGHAKRLDNARTDYEFFCRSTVPPGADFSGFKIVVDCSHGAAYKVAPRVMAELGADVIPIGCSPNGRNINANCGSTRPELLQATVRGVGADVGIALDGDGDRVVMVDSSGEMVDGDQLIHILAAAAHEEGRLRGPVVGTVMSNLGLELSLTEKGIEFRRAAVGDRNVLALLKASGGHIGGETSGHVIDLAKTTTGDGLIVALQVLAVMEASGRSLGELASIMPRFPQTLINVRTTRAFDDTAVGIVEAVRAVQGRFGKRGRIVLRPSGTEPVVRVMVEGEDEQQVTAAAEEIAAAVRAALSED